MKAKVMKPTRAGGCLGTRAEPCDAPASCEACVRCTRHCDCRRKPVVEFDGRRFHLVWSGKTRAGDRRVKLLAIDANEVAWAAADQVRGVYADDGRGIPRGGK